MYYTANYWVTLLVAETGRLIAYGDAVNKPQSDSNRAQEIKDADTKFERLMRAASKEADAELAATRWAEFKERQAAEKT